MGRDDNYPDDIRMYDNDPRSPFYEDDLDDEELNAKYEAEIDAEEDERKFAEYEEK